MCSPGGGVQEGGVRRGPETPGGQHLTAAAAAGSQLVVLQDVDGEQTL